VSAVSVTPVTSLEGGRARQGQHVAVSVRPADFADPDAELPRLAAQLERHLRERAVLGFDLTVSVSADA
jgi:hypothetical protein